MLNHETQFEKYLEEILKNTPGKQATIRTYISDCRAIEATYYDLEEAYKLDKLELIFFHMKHMTLEEGHQRMISRELRANLAKTSSYATSLNHYKEFLRQFFNQQRKLQKLIA
jgi:hypothetical protein